MSVVDSGKERGGGGGGDGVIQRQSEAFYLKKKFGFKITVDSKILRTLKNGLSILPRSNCVKS